MKYLEIRSLPPEVQARMLKLLRRRGAIVSEAESRRVARAQRARNLEEREEILHDTCHVEVGRGRAAKTTRRVSQPTETGDDSSER